MDNTEKEARVFTHYLIHREATPQAIKLYKVALDNSMPNSSDQKLLNFMVSHPSSISFIDAGLVFLNPDSEARRRLYVMFAIVEASVENHDLFLSKKRNPFYLVTIILVGIRAVVKAGLGLVLVKVIA